MQRRDPDLTPLEKFLDSVGRREALLSLKNLADRFAADCGLDGVLYIGNADSIAVGLSAIHDQVHVPAGEILSEAKDLLMNGRDGQI